MHRKQFIRHTGMAAAALTVSGNLFAGYADPKIKVAIIGTGLRGQNHLDLLLRRDDVEVTAICDIDDRMLAAAKEMITKSGKKVPPVFTGDVYAWKIVRTKR
jgi:threonine dehydrogenase-like Zn-dependent dehydrogenase